MCAPQIYSSMAIILILMYQDGTICPAQVLSTASALRPLERDGGPNCALCSVHLVPLERMVSPTVLCALHLHWDLLREMVGPTVQRVWCLYCLWTRFHNWTRGNPNRVQAGTALATAWRASTVVSGIMYCGVEAGRGTRVEGKCDLQSGLTPTMAPHTMCQPYGSPCHTDDNSNKELRQSKQLKKCRTNWLCWSLIPSFKGFH